MSPPAISEVFLSLVPLRGTSSGNVPALNAVHIESTIISACVKCCAHRASHNFCLRIMNVVRNQLVIYLGCRYNKKGIEIIEKDTK